eukprot:1054446-Prorocentrum_minimum.AAC.2
MQHQCRSTCEVDPRGEQWEKVGNWTQGEKRGRVSGVMRAPLPSLAQEDPRYGARVHLFPQPNARKSYRVHTFIVLPTSARIAASFIANATRTTVCWEQGVT